MARGIDWHGVNKVLGPPQGMDESQVSRLPIFTNGVTCVSCWEPSEEELAEIVRTKKIFVSVFFGQSMPPIFVGSESEVRDVVADYGAWPRMS